MRLGIRLWPVLLILGCTTPQPSVVPSSGLVVAHPDGLTVPVGGTLRFLTNFPVPAGGWKLQPASRDKAVIDQSGNLQALKPGAIEFSAMSPDAPNSYLVTVAAFDAPSSEEYLALRTGLPMTSRIFVVLNSEAELDRLWVAVGARPDEKRPTVDFTQRSVVAIFRNHTEANWHRAVFTHLEPGTPPTVHFAFPNTYRGERGAPEGRMELVAIPKVPEDAMVAWNGRLGRTQEEYYSPVPGAAASPLRPEAEVYPAEACVGSEVTVIGKDYPPGQGIELQARSGGTSAGEPVKFERLILGQVTVGTDGTFTFPLRVTESHLQFAGLNDGDLFLHAIPRDNRFGLEDYFFTTLTVCPAGQSVPLR